jgi:hypothetical protein
VGDLGEEGDWRSRFMASIKEIEARPKEAELATEAATERRYFLGGEYRRVVEDTDFSGPQASTRFFVMRGGNLLETVS